MPLFPKLNVSQTSAFAGRPHKSVPLGPCHPTSRAGPRVAGLTLATESRSQTLSRAPWHLSALTCQPPRVTDMIHQAGKGRGTNRKGHRRRQIREAVRGLTAALCGQKCHILQARTMLINFAKVSHPCLSILGDVSFFPVILSPASLSRFPLEWQVCRAPARVAAAVTPGQGSGLCRLVLLGRRVINEKLLYKTVKYDKMG